MIVEAVTVLQMQQDEEEADAAHAQQDHSARAVGPPLRPPVPAVHEDPSLAGSVAVPHQTVIPPLPRPINGGIAPVHKPPILPKNASARTVRGCTSAPVIHEDDGGHSTVRSHVQEVDTSESGGDDDPGRAFTLPRIGPSVQPGGRPDTSVHDQPLPMSLDVTYVHDQPLPVSLDVTYVHDQPAPVSLDVTYVQPCEGTSRETPAALLPTPDADAVDLTADPSQESQLLSKKAKKAARAKELRAAKKLNASLAAAQAADADHPIQEASDSTVHSTASAAASLSVASQPDGVSDLREVRPRRPDQPSPLVEPMPGSVVAHGRRLPAAFSAASVGAMASSLSVFSPLGSHDGRSCSSPGPSGVPAALHARVASGPVENATHGRSNHCRIIFPLLCAVLEVVARAFYAPYRTPQKCEQQYYVCTPTSKRVRPSSTSFHSPSARGRGCRTGPSVPTSHRG
jgi:hypothetical protein